MTFFCEKEDTTEVNFANANARAVAGAAGLDLGEYLSGSIRAEEVPEAIRKIDAALESDLSAWTRETEVHGNLISCGLSDEQLRSRLVALRNVLRRATEINSEVLYG